MSPRSLSQGLLGTALVLGLALGGCYGDYAATTADADAGTGTTGGGSGGTGGGTTTVDAGGASSTETTNQDFTTPTSPTCTNGTGRTGGSSSMDPGQPCITCHKANGGPSFPYGGTVFAKPHEKDNCNGVSGIKVVITDANGVVTSVTTNSAGNFYGRSSLKMPYTAQLVSSTGVTRTMFTPQTNGDCNSCHTVAGTNNAPGRIMAP